MTRARTWTAILGAATLLVAAGAAHAQVDPAYKCWSRSGVTYTQVPCAGGKQVGTSGRSRTDKTQPVPQDRARIAKRAVLSDEDRRECTALDARMAEQEAELRAKGDGATLDDEMPLVRSKKRFRELRC
ncbi:MAG TPA: hypothetical protein VNB23_04165 [Ramlibacter sp.]|nr:hypothetical protein [Ramlibacter sp.]